MRLIDADALLESYDVAWMYEYDETGCGVRRKAIPIKCVEDAPTIEAEPVRHGRWVKVEEESDMLESVWKCSDDKCGCKVGAYGIFTPYGLGYVYCPSCGAKMGGGTDHE